MLAVMMAPDSPKQHNCIFLGNAGGMAISVDLMGSTNSISNWCADGKSFRKETNFLSSNRSGPRTWHVGFSS